MENDQKLARIVLHPPARFSIENLDLLDYCVKHSTDRPILSDQSGRQIVGYPFKRITSYPQTQRTSNLHHILQ